MKGLYEKQKAPSFAIGCDCLADVFTIDQFLNALRTIVGVMVQEDGIIWLLQAQYQSRTRLWPTINR